MRCGKKLRKMNEDSSFLFLNDNWEERIIILIGGKEKEELSVINVVIRRNFSKL